MDEFIMSLESLMESNTVYPFVVYPSPPFFTFFERLDFYKKRGGWV